MAQPGSSGQPALPKVRVAEDSRTFTVGKQKSFVPMGVTYYRPGTGWAPQVWKQFDREATRKDFVRMRELGVNCVRVFLTFGSFYRKTGELDAAGLAKFDEFLAIAEQAGIYVHPTGPDHWEGMPNWNPAGIEDERTLAALEGFWKLFAARYRDRTGIFAYDLRNEPEVGWDDRMKPAWNAWLARRYGGAEAIAKAWGRTNVVELDKIPVPAPTEATELQQAEYCRKVVRTSAGFVCGCLNWGLFDQPEATDCSELTGLVTADGRTKEWGKTFQTLAKEFKGQRIPSKTIGARPVLDWEACVTSAAAGREFQRRYWEAFRRDPF
jgi:hypothetical protein